MDGLRRRAFASRVRTPCRHCQRHLKGWSRSSLNLYLRVEGCRRRRSLGNAHVEVDRLRRSRSGRIRAAMASLRRHAGRRRRGGAGAPSGASASARRRRRAPTPRGGRRAPASGRRRATAARRIAARAVAPSSSSHVRGRPRCAAARPSCRARAVPITRPRAETSQESRALSDDGDRALGHDAHARACAGRRGRAWR